MRWSLCIRFRKTDQVLLTLSAVRPGCLARHSGLPSLTVNTPGCSSTLADPVILSALSVSSLCALQSHSLLLSKHSPGLFPVVPSPPSILLWPGRAPLGLPCLPPVGRLSGPYLWVIRVLSSSRSGTGPSLLLLQISARVLGIWADTGKLFLKHCVIN